MSAFWSWFIIVLVAINIVGCLWLLWYTSKRRGANAHLPDSETTGHVWDGDLSEYNKPLPRWWINLFYLTIFFSIAYVAWYGGLGHYDGIGRWSSAGEHDAEKAEADARLAETLAPFEGMAIDQLAANPAAVDLGKSVFGNYCATCHGSDARGARGFPNLTDASWQWGGSPDEVATSVIHGRQAAMPAMEAMLGEQGATEVAVYVQQLAGLQADPGLAAAGKTRFDTICAACHMPDGTGMAALGAPNLTDDVWLYGSDFDTIRQGVLQGRAGMMPAHGPIVGETRARLAAAYVWSLSHGADAAAAND